MHFSSEFTSDFGSQEMLDIENEILKITNELFLPESSSTASGVKRTRENKVSLFKRNADVSSDEEACEKFPSDGSNEPKKRKSNVSSFSSLSPDEKNEISRGFLSNCNVSKHNLSELHSTNKSGKSQILEKENNSNKSGSGAVKDVSRSLFSYLNKFAYKAPEESEENKTSVTSEISCDQEEMVDSSTVVQPTREDDIQSKDNKEIVKKSAVELTNIDDCIASFDIDFDDDCEGMFDCDIEEKGNGKSISPTKPSSSPGSFSTNSSMKVPDSKKFCEVPTGDLSNSNLVSNSFQRIEDNFDSCINDLTGNHHSVPVTQENVSIRHGTFWNSNESCQSSVKRPNLKSSEILPSPAYVTSRKSRVQRQCSTPTTRQNEISNRSFNSDTESTPNLFSSLAKFSRNNSNKVQKRKFPGPAGILPDLPPGTDLSTLKQAKFLNKRTSSDCFYQKEMICSQGTLEQFEKAPWQNMLKDISVHSDVQLIKRFNIRLALWKSSRKRLPKHIVFPAICVLLTDIKFNSNEVEAVFKDETGEIPGRIRIDAVEKYKEYIVPLSAFVIKRAEFLFYQLIVKPDNIAAIYSPDGNNQLPLQDAEFENIMAEQSHHFSKKQQNGESVGYPEHSSSKNQSRDISLNDDYESFFADDMDDLLKGIDDNCSTNS